MRVAIVGGGISGLSCAYYLGRAGVDATVFDPSPGGLIGTESVEGCLLETGPESWLAAKPWAEQLVRELGMGADLVGSNDASRKTYIVRKGRFVPLPEGLQLVVPTKLRPLLDTPLFSWRTKIRMAFEIFRSPKVFPDRSVSEFVNDHFGPEAVEYLAEPLLAGVYGGSTDRLSAPSVLPKFVQYEQRYGSLIVGSLRRAASAESQSAIFLSLRRGMGSLISELTSRVNIVPSRVDGIGRGQEGWGIKTGGEWQPFDQMVLACGANRAAPLLEPHDTRLGELLASIPHSGSEIWTMGFRREDVPHPLDAFGFLVPKDERRAVMACTWVNTKWLGRVPPETAVLRCFSTETGVTKEAVMADLHRLMGIQSEPVFALHHAWPNSMPQYTVGHTERVGEIESRVSAFPGLHLAGNAYHGIGIPDCVRSAREAAGAVVSATTSPTSLPSSHPEAP